jgi:hypothetical protein
LRRGRWAGEEVVDCMRQDLTVQAGVISSTVDEMFVGAQVFAKVRPQL